jgi:hypothetical protein
VCLQLLELIFKSSTLFVVDAQQVWQLEYVEVLMKMAAQKSSFAVNETSEVTLANVLEQNTSYV